MSNIMINEYKELLFERNEIDMIKQQVELSKKYKSRLHKIEARLKELEQATKLINRKTARHLTLLKLSCGMDSLNSIQKERSVSFANALNAIEGINTSEAMQLNIDKWKVGEKSFFDIFQEALNMYGIETDE